MARVPDMKEVHYMEGMNYIEGLLFNEGIYCEEGIYYIEGLSDRYMSNPALTWQQKSYWEESVLSKINYLITTNDEEFKAVQITWLRKEQKKRSP